MSFHECGTVFDPVACVAIGHTVQFMNLWRMNVTANDSVASSMTSMSGEVALELLNILRQCRESALDSRDQRAVPNDGTLSQPAPERIEPQQSFVATTKEPAGQARYVFASIELVTMENKKPSAISKFVMELFFDSNQSIRVEN